MTADQVWTEKNFEEMSWHDNHVHGLRISEGEYGAGELEFDMDHITRWRNSEGGFEFRIVPATLTFREVTNLQVSLDYATPTAALGPFSIASIERESQQRERYVAQVWKILINWPNGAIKFESTGFVQRGVGEPVLSKEQRLAPAQRGSRA